LVRWRLVKIQNLQPSYGSWKHDLPSVIHGNRPDDSLWDKQNVDDLAAPAPGRVTRRVTHGKRRVTPADEALFDKFPRSWSLKMKDSSVGAFKIALLLLQLRWKAMGRPIVVSDAEAAARGVGHRRKVSAILELEKLGLIRVKRRPKKSSRLP